MEAARDSSSGQEIEHRRRFDQGFGIPRRSELQPGQGHPAHGAVFNGEGDLIDKPLFRGNHRDQRGDPESEVDDIPLRSSRNARRAAIFSMFRGAGSILPSGRFSSPLTAGS